VAALKEIRNRINSVKKTRKITSAMKVVSAAKLARAQRALQAARPFASKLREVLASVSSGVDADAHPLLARRERVLRLDVVLFTSDRGLCGAFNSNMIKRAEQLIAERRPALEQVSVVPIGRRGGDYFRRRRYVFPYERSGIAVPSPEIAAAIAQVLAQRYLSGETDEVALVFGEFRSAVAQAPLVEPLLPFTAPEGGAGLSYEMEPGAEELLGLLLPRAVEFGVYRALLESAASEHGARMTAMEAASGNCAELINRLTLDMNKARQTAITQELSEIVGGAEAL
jgi:F-type H+-transporting ATPase subunit gamma